MKTCPTCQQTYTDDTDSCPRDGARLAAESREERECPSCAERILKKARVCKHCGHDVEPLTKSDTPTQAPSPATPRLTKAENELLAGASRIAEHEADEGMWGRPAAAADRPPELGKSDTPAQTPPPAPPQRIVEAPPVKSQGSTPPLSRCRKPEASMRRSHLIVSILVAGIIVVGAFAWHGYQEARQRAMEAQQAKDAAAAEERRATDIRQQQQQKREDFARACTEGTKFGVTCSAGGQDGTILAIAYGHANDDFLKGHLQRER